MNDKVIALQKKCEELETKFTDPKKLFDLRRIAQADPNNYKRVAAMWRKYSVGLAKDLKEFRKMSIEVAKAMPVHHRRVSQ